VDGERVHTGHLWYSKYVARSSKPYFNSFGSTVVHRDSGEQSNRGDRHPEKVRAKFNYSISYGKARRDKERAVEDIFGPSLYSYDCVVRLLHILQERIMGTYVNIQDFWMLEFWVLHRVFFSSIICIETFSHCRPVYACCLIRSTA
jgi:hypothetical protein